MRLLRYLMPSIIFFIAFLLLQNYISGPSSLFSMSSSGPLSSILSMGGNPEVNENHSYKVLVKKENIEKTYEDLAKTCKRQAGCEITAKHAKIKGYFGPSKYYLKIETSKANLNKFMLIISKNNGIIAKQSAKQNNSILKNNPLKKIGNMANMGSIPNIADVQKLANVATLNANPASAAATNKVNIDGNILATDPISNFLNVKPKPAPQKAKIETEREIKVLTNFQAPIVKSDDLFLVESNKIQIEFLIEKHYASASGKLKGQLFNAVDIVVNNSIYIFLPLIAIFILFIFRIIYKELKILLTKIGQHKAKKQDKKKIIDIKEPVVNEQKPISPQSNNIEIRTNTASESGEPKLYKKESEKNGDENSIELAPKKYDE